MAYEGQRALPESDSGGEPSSFERLRAAVQARQGSDEPRHSRLRAAMLELMADGYWAPGDKLPSEKEIADAVGLSQGTIQKALARLAESNIVVRRHGHGTFVGTGSQSDQLLHFRFLGDDGVALVPVFAEALERKEVKSKGRWSQFLASASSFIRVRRRINVADEFDCLSEFYIDASRFPEILAIPMQQLHRVRIRTLLAERFNAPTRSLTQHAYATQFPDEVIHLLKLPKKSSCGMVLEVFSYTHHQSPVSFQRIYIPPDVRHLVIPSPQLHAK